MNLTPYMLVTTRLEALGHKVQNVKPHADGIVRAARTDCPACGAHARPLEIAERGDGAVLLYCHQGCRAGAIAGALGIGVADLFPPRDPRAERITGAQGPILHWTVAGAATDAALDAVDRAIRGDVAALAAARSNLIDLRQRIKSAIRADVAAARQLATDPKNKQPLP